MVGQVGKIRPQLVGTRGWCVVGLFRKKREPRQPSTEELVRETERQAKRDADNYKYEHRNDHVREWERKSGM